MFGSTIGVGVAVKDLLSDSGIDLLIESVTVIKWFSSVGGVLDCEEVDWGVFDVVLFNPVGL